jgi:pimeloyl-ACP methyl ester carboxylesterase
MIRKVLAAILGIAILTGLGTVLLYRTDARDRRALLAGGSEVAQTERGPIEYRILGDDGPVVVFLHGTPGGYDSEWQMPGYRVLVPSRPGYLGTPLSTGKTPFDQAGALASLLDFLGLERVAIVGLSGGGPAAIHFAARFPSRTIALIALESVSEPVFLDGELPLIWRSDFFGWLFFAAGETFLSTDALLATVIPDQANRERILVDPAKIAAAKGMMWQSWPAASGRAAGIRNDIAQFRTLNLPFSQVGVPTLVIHGEADAAVPVSTGRQLAARIANSQLQVIPIADHFMVVTHAEIIKQSIDDFLSDLRRSGYIEQH